MASAQEPSADEAAVRKVIKRYVDAREARDAKDIESLLTPDADQPSPTGLGGGDATSS